MEAPRLFLFELQPVFSCTEARMDMGAFPCLAREPSFNCPGLPPSLFLQPLVTTYRKPAQQFL